MGISGISLWQLLIVLLIVVLIFGTKKLRSMGGDLGSAVRSFRSAMSGDARDEDASGAQDKDAGRLPGGADEQRSERAQEAPQRDADFDEERRADKDRDAMHR